LFLGARTPLISISYRTKGEKKVLKGEKKVLLKGEKGT